MAENPLTKLARVLGGAAILPGPLGHQVLGQLLISRSTSVEVAGASVAVAAVSRHRSAAAQIAVRTVAPAAVVEALSRKEQRRLAEQQRRLERLSTEIAQQSHATAQIALLWDVPPAVAEILRARYQRELEAQRQLEEERLGRLTEATEANRRRLDEEQQRQHMELQALSAKVGEELERMQTLRCQNEQLRQEVEDLRGRLDDYASARTTGTRKRESAEPPEATPEPKARMGLRASPRREKPVIDASGNSAAPAKQSAPEPKKRTARKKKPVTAKKTAARQKTGPST